MASGVVEFFGLSEGDDVANLAFGAGVVGVFLGGAAAVGGRCALELTEGIADGLIATAKNPVNNFTFAHDVKVVEAEIATIDH